MRLLPRQKGTTLLSPFLKKGVLRSEKDKWIALSNTTVGILMATINSNIVLIALPAIFNGIGINPLAPGETNYPLRMLLGYMMVTATLVVVFGRISDMFGRVKLYNLGFAIFTLGLVALQPSSLSSGLEQVGLSASTAHQIASLPPLAALFAAFLGYNPMGTLLPQSTLHQLPAASQAQLLGQSFFPNQIAGPFMLGLHVAFYLAAVLCLIGAFASLVREKRPAVERTVSDTSIESVDDALDVAESSRR